MSDTPPPHEIVIDLADKDAWDDTALIRAYDRAIRAYEDAHAPKSRPAVSTSNGNGHGKYASRLNLAEAEDEDSEDTDEQLDFWGSRRRVFGYLSKHGRHDLRRLERDGRRWWRRRCEARRRRVEEDADGPPWLERAVAIVESEKDGAKRALAALRGDVDLHEADSDDDGDAWGDSYSEASSSAGDDDAW